jgi:hypothetical protein
MPNKEIRRLERSIKRLERRLEELESGSVPEAPDNKPEVSFDKSDEPKGYSN